MTDVLLAQQKSPEFRPAAPRIEPGRRRRGPRWMVLAATFVLLCGVLGALLFDAAQENHRYDRSRHLLAVTHSMSSVVSRDLAAARIDLRLVTQQVGTDTTALTQDTSQLQGASSALTAAQAHVFEQASLLNSLHECLAGVEQALNALAVGNQAEAADALKTVTAPCSTAVNASG